jgi:hypothetical protein
MRPIKGVLLKRGSPMLSILRKRGRFLKNRYADRDGTVTRIAADLGGSLVRIALIRVALGFSLAGHARGELTARVDEVMALPQGRGNRIDHGQAVVGGHAGEPL